MDVLLQYKALVGAVVLLMLFVLERRRSADHWPPQPQQRHMRLLNNFGLWLINVAASLLIVLPVTALAAGHALAWRPDWWQGAVGLALDIVLLDLAIFGWHIANHRVALLWRFHRVHHEDEFLDVTSALRFHAGEVLLSACARAVLIVLLGLPLGSVLVFETLVLLAAGFHHSNLRLPLRLEWLLSQLIVTPSIHWVHHHAVRAHTDSNYGTIFSFWDRLFRTRSDFARQMGMRIGVQGGSEQNLARLLLQPFSERD
jgi:sterol desaturase/sphingolipid hydroxylase (fatty acid hydroxylase superfamily)